MLEIVAFVLMFVILIIGLWLTTQQYKDKQYYVIKDTMEIISDNQKSQFKDLERYCKYHKEGQKIVIDEVFENPLPSNSQSGRPTSIISEFCIDEDKFYTRKFR